VGRVVKVRVSISIEKKILAQIDRTVADQASPFYGRNRSNLIEYCVRKTLPAEPDLSVVMEPKRR